MNIVHRVTIALTAILALAVTGCGSAATPQASSGANSTTQDSQGGTVPEKESCNEFASLQHQLLGKPLPTTHEEWDTFNAPFFDIAKNASGEVGKAMRAYTDSIKKSGGKPPYDYPYGSGSMDTFNALVSACDHVDVRLRQGG